MALKRLEVGLIGLVVALGCSTEQKSPKRKAGQRVQTVAATTKGGGADINPRLLRRFKPAREVIGGQGNDLNKAKVELGRQLFHDARLSARRQHSCNDCHRLTEYGADGRKVSPGGNRNAPTVFHAASHFEFSDGKAKTIEEQALDALLSPRQTGAPSEEYVLEELEAIPAYVSAFRAAFPSEAQPLTFANVGNAIGAFERHLTSKSRWDAFLGGDPSALRADEAEGLKLFLNLGCAVCHTGEDLGGTMYEKLGAVERWPNQRDQGRYEVTRKDADRMIFKVPTLRNVAETGPYFHDGGTGDLSTAVTLMAKHQIGMKLEPAEVESIVAWLKTLTGQISEDQTAMPNLPSGGTRTVSDDAQKP